MSNDYYEVLDAPEQKKNNRTWWIILVVIAVVLLCCCCIVVLIATFLVPVQQYDQLFYDLVPFLGLI